MTVLITGGAGFIGSHTCVELLNSGYDAVVLDNLSNGYREAVNRVEKITGKSVRFYDADILDPIALDKIFTENKIDAIIHFAGLKAVGESAEKPEEYYKVNVGGTASLLAAAKKAGCKKIIFSSSATVYDFTRGMPLKEGMPTAPISPYGRTKLFAEKLLADFQAANGDASVMVLRYFNPIGAHKSGLIGEVPRGIPNNLMPYISQVAVKKREKLFVFGNDYNTADGTGARDYLHVIDLAKGHVAALEYVTEHQCFETVNLGTGSSTTVFELINAFQGVNKIEIPYEITERRSGDFDAFYADNKKAAELLGWRAECTLEDMCRDTWNFQKNNPNGYNN